MWNKTKDSTPYQQIDSRRNYSCKPQSPLLFFDSIYCGLKNYLLEPQLIETHQIRETSSENWRVMFHPLAQFITFSMIRVYVCLLNTHTGLPSIQEALIFSKLRRSFLGRVSSCDCVKVHTRGCGEHTGLLSEETITRCGLEGYDFGNTRIIPVQITDPVLI